MFYNLAMLNDEGYRDFYSKQKQIVVFCYVKIGSPKYHTDGSYLGLVTAGNADYLDNGDGSFTVVAVGAGTHGKSYSVYHMQSGGDEIESYVDTINILFYPDKIVDHTIQLFIKTAVSLSGMEVSYSSDGNYTFRALKGKPIGNVRVCGVFPGSATAASVRYRGTNSFTISHMEINQRDAYSIKFRVKARNEMNDEFKLYSIELNSAGLWFEGGDGDA